MSYLFYIVAECDLFNPYPDKFIFEKYDDAKDYLHDICKRLGVLFEIYYEEDTGYYEIREMDDNAPDGFVNCINLY